MKTQRIYIGVAGLVAGMLAAACSSAGTTTVQSTTATRGVGVSAASGLTTTTSAAAGEARKIGPLEAMFRMSKDDMISRQKRVEASVLKCMAQEGFKYIPRDVSQDMAGFDDTTDYLGLEYRKKHGYGFTFDFEAQNNPNPVTDTKPFVDPNQAIQDKMTETERAAYQSTLYGKQTAEKTVSGNDATSAITTVASTTPVDQGCYGKAQTTIFGDTNKLQESMQPKYEALTKKQTDDPRIVKAQKAWSDCMKSSGHPFESPDKIQELLSNLMNTEVYKFDSSGGGVSATVVGGVGGAVVVSTAVVVGTAVPVDGKGGFGGPQYDKEGLKKVHAEEVAILDADLGCDAKTSLTKIHLDVQFELETQFVEENQLILDQLVKAQNGK